MNDLIDRDAVLHEAEKAYSFEDRRGQLAHAIQAIKNAPAVNRWIPCSERMPAEWQIVAAYGEKIGLKCVEWHPEMGVFIDTQSEYDEQIKPEYFTRWIPLPEEGADDA